MLFGTSDCDIFVITTDNFSYSKRFNLNFWIEKIIRILLRQDKLQKEILLSDALLS